MDKRELDAVISLFSGVEIAIAHLVGVLETKNIATRVEIAQSFRETAAAIADDVPNAKAIKVVLSRIASLSESGRSEHDAITEIGPLLH